MGLPPIACWGGLPQPGQTAPAGLHGREPVDQLLAVLVRLVAVARGEATGQRAEDRRHDALISEWPLAQLELDAAGDLARRDRRLVAAAVVADDAASY